MEFETWRDKLFQCVIINKQLLSHGTALARCALLGLTTTARSSRHALAGLAAPSSLDFLSILSISISALSLALAAAGVRSRSALSAVRSRQSARLTPVDGDDLEHERPESVEAAAAERIVCHRSCELARARARMLSCPSDENVRHSTASTSPSPTHGLCTVHAVRVSV